MIGQPQRAPLATAGLFLLSGVRPKRGVVALEIEIEGLCIDANTNRPMQDPLQLVERNSFYWSERCTRKAISSCEMDNCADTKQDYYPQYEGWISCVRHE